MSEDALQFLGFTGSIGDTISLPLSKALRHDVTIEPYDYQADFVLTGITQNNYLGYLYGSILGFVGEGTAKEILPQKYLYYCMDIRTVNSKNFQEIVDDLIQTLDIHELDTIYNHAYLNALGIHYNASEDGSMIDDEGFPFLILAGVLVTVLVLLAAGLVIYNILKISAARRIGQYGVLRAIGAEKGQLYGIVAAEVLLSVYVWYSSGSTVGISFVERDFGCSVEPVLTRIVSCTGRGAASDNACGEQLFEMGVSFSKCSNRTVVCFYGISSGCILCCKGISCNCNP